MSLQQRRHNQEDSKASKQQSTGGTGVAAGWYEATTLPLPHAPPEQRIHGNTDVHAAPSDVGGGSLKDVAANKSIVSSY
jgi:RecA-family ATPase